MKLYTFWRDRDLGQAQAFILAAADGRLAGLQHCSCRHFRPVAARTRLHRIQIDVRFVRILREFPRLRRLSQRVEEKAQPARIDVLVYSHLLSPGIPLFRGISLGGSTIWRTRQDIQLVRRIGRSNG